MTLNTFNLTPRDLLFLRDARPMQASDAGRGANWPRPDQVWNAVDAMFKRQWPTQQEDIEGQLHTVNDGDKHQKSSFRFGGLQTVGPFPCKDNQVYLPCPLDLTATQERGLRPMTLMQNSLTNLPKPLTHLFCAAEQNKLSLPQYLSADDYQRYLKGEDISIANHNDSDLYDCERTIGIGIEADTRATKDGQIYQAEYLRLKENVSLAFLASCVIKPKNYRAPRPEVDVFAVLRQQLGGIDQLPVIIGGQQGVATLSEGIWKLPDNPLPAVIPSSLQLRWTLITPAIFPAIQQASGGWLPTWINPEDGAVMFPGDKPPKKPGESREAWRQRINASTNGIQAHLIAARIGKPVYFSGWNQQFNIPKDTIAAVPAGSVYVFRCQNETAFVQLWQRLTAINADGGLNPRSGDFGEKGYGFGFCSIIPDSHNK